MGSSQQVRRKETYTSMPEGWLISISALTQLWDMVHEDELNFLLISRLNQDCLENTFSVKRQKERFRNNPDSE